MDPVTLSGFMFALLWVVGGITCAMCFIYGRSVGELKTEERLHHEAYEKGYGRWVGTYHNVFVWNEVPEQPDPTLREYSPIEKEFFPTLYKSTEGEDIE